MEEKKKEGRLVEEEGKECPYCHVPIGQGNCGLCRNAWIIKHNGGVMVMC